MIIKHKRWKGILSPSLYTNNDSLALQLVDESDGQLIMTFTVNMVNEQFPAGDIAIKNYSENEGSVETLIEHDIIEAPVVNIHSGFVDIPVAGLTDRAKNYIGPILEKQFPDKNINSIIGEYDA